MYIARVSHINKAYMNSMHMLQSTIDGTYYVNRHNIIIHEMQRMNQQRDIATQTDKIHFYSRLTQACPIIFHVVAIVIELYTS